MNPDELILHLGRKDIALEYDQVVELLQKSHFLQGVIGIFVVLDSLETIPNYCDQSV